jgi:sugar-specific transcriptional regulator TrmB
MIVEVENLIRRRLAELGDEERRLQRALELLSPNGAARPRKPGRRNATAPRASTATPRGAKRAAPGERQRQLVDAIRKMPGASPNELADAIGVGSTQVYGMVRLLQAKGEIERKGQGFVVIGRES